jgi:C-terminal processing protease CtpA/Prc
MRDGRLEVGGARTAPGLRKMLSSSHLPSELQLDFSWEYKENSDHWPLFMAGVPSLLMHTGLHDDYHTPRDDFEKLNIAGIRLATAYVLEAVSTAADVEALPNFRQASRSENPSVQKLREAPLAPVEPRLGLTWVWTKQGDGHVLRIENVVRGSAAEAAGLAIGDDIIAVDGMPIANEFLLAAAVLRAEKELLLSVVRNGEPAADVTVALTGSPTQLGLSWREDDGEPGTVFITRVVPHSPAARAGIKLNDRLYALNGEPLTNGDALLSQVRELLAAESPTLQFEVEAAGHIRTVDVDLQLPLSPSGDATL